MESRRTSRLPIATTSRSSLRSPPDAERIVPNWHVVDKLWDAYIRVDDVDAVYAEVQERGAPIDYTIYDTPWGFREFGVQDPDGHDIAIGQRVSGD